MGKKTRPPYSEIEYRGRENTRGTTSVYHDLTAATFQSVHQHPRSITGTPVAAYLEFVSVHCLQDVFSHGFPSVSHQPTALSTFPRAYLFPLKRIFYLVVSSIISY